jgi:flagellar basal-body rod protein FlgB
MDGSTAVLMIKALDCLSARSIATAENIANAGTPNYRPLRVSFEQALVDASAKGDAAVAAVTPSVERAPADAPGEGLRLDLEMGTAAATSGRYGALIDILNRELQMQSLVITGNS